MLVLFDLDGTLVTTAGAGRRALAEAFRDVFGVDSFDARTRDVEYAGRTDPAIIVDLARALGIAASRLEQSTPALYEAYYTALRREMAQPDPRRRVLPGVLALLEELSRREAVFLGLLTGNLEPGARIKLEPFGLNRFFPDGGFGTDHADRGEIARVAVEKLGRRRGIPFAPLEVWVIGDTDHDVACARANGYRAIVVYSRWVSRERLVRWRPDACFDSLEDLPAVLGALGLRVTG
jgi:phosphoglycolate phosphatase-like HAD superfamily hydrolase